MGYDSDYLMRLAGKAMVIYAKHLTKRWHRGKSILSNQITFLYRCLSLLDRLTLKLLNLPNFLVAFYFHNKGELKLFGSRRTQKQFVFTYNDRTNNINLLLHTDYLNYRMKSSRKRHPELAPASPHKLRHTGATLAKQAGLSLEAISEALTHSDKEVTKTYVNTKDTVNQTVGDIAFRSLKK